MVQSEVAVVSSLEVERHLRRRGPRRTRGRPAAGKGKSICRFIVTAGVWSVAMESTFGLDIPVFRLHSSPSLLTTLAPRSEG